MLRNYLKIAWRNLVKNPGYSVINITGLATGMAVALLVGLWIWDELSFNTNHANYQQLAQVKLNQTYKGETYTDETIAMPLGDALRTTYQADFKDVSLVSWENDQKITSGDNKLSTKARWVQPAFPEMFTIKMVSGDRSALKDPSTILVAASFAKALFGNDVALNKTVKLNDKLSMKIGGVFEDLPYNSTFYNTKLLLPWDNPENWLNKQTAWDNHCGLAFVQLNRGASMDEVSAKIRNVPTPHISKVKEELILQPINELRLFTEFKNGVAVGGRIRFVYLFGIIGGFVLLLACINFMNLSTARSERRAREVGIRKSVGSVRSQLVWQFLSEAFLITFLSFLLALVMVKFSLPFFNGLADKKMTLPWIEPVFWFLAVGFILLTAVLSGSYPAFYLSKFEPIKVLKGVFTTGRFASLPRKILVVVQFSVSVCLIIATIIVYQQIQYARNRPAGYSRNGLISVPLNSELYGKYEVLRNRLLGTGVVENMAESSQPASHFSNNNSIDWKGKDPETVIYFRNVNVTADFGNTIGWSISAGRDFSKEFKTDTAAVIINETGIKSMGLQNPLGQIIRYDEKDYHIVGIAKDMLTQSPYEPMEPTIFFCSSWMGVITIRIKPTVATSDALSKLENVFRELNPADPFQYSFVDEVYAKKYSDEVKIGNLSSFFAILAIFISCLGLFGLASFVAEQRTKEIGVRKVLGATVFNLWRMQSKEFVTLVIISCLVSIPVAWHYLNQWLQNFYYRVDISWWVFIVAIASALVITLLTVSFHAIKAAIANPVKSLRSE